MSFAFALNPACDSFLALTLRFTCAEAPAIMTRMWIIPLHSLARRCVTSGRLISRQLSSERGAMPSLERGGVVGHASNLQKTAYLSNFQEMRPQSRRALSGSFYDQGSQRVGLTADAPNLS